MIIIRENLEDEVIAERITDNFDIVKARHLDKVIDYDKFRYLKPWLINRLLIQCRTNYDIRMALYGYENYASIKSRAGGYNPFHDEIRMVLVSLKLHYLGVKNNIKLNPYVVKGMIYDYTTHENVEPQRMKEIVDFINEADEESCVVYLKDLSTKGGIERSIIFANYTRPEKVMIAKMLEFKRINDFDFGTAYREYCFAIAEAEKKGRKKK